MIHYYTEIHMPLGSIKNSYEQINDLIPDKFIIYEEDEVPKDLKEHAGSILTTTATEEEINQI